MEYLLLGVGLGTRRENGDTRLTASQTCRLNTAGYDDTIDAAREKITSHSALRKLKGR